MYFFVCKCVLPLGDYQIVVNKYTICNKVHNLKNTYIDTAISCFNSSAVKEQGNENPNCATNTEIVNNAVDSGKEINGRKKYCNGSQR
jgi:hypothetical protein